MIEDVNIDSLVPIFSEQLQVGGIPITIHFTKFHPAVPSFGLTLYGLREIWISAQTGVELTLYHELAHMVSWMHDANDDSLPYTGEKLVQFAANVAQIAASPPVQRVLKRIRAEWPDTLASDSDIGPDGFTRVPSCP